MRPEIWLMASSTDVNCGVNAVEPASNPAGANSHMMPREEFFAMRQLGTIIVALGLAASPALVLEAHFRLIEPASWIVENERGDPQKAAPCGADAKAEMSKALTPVKGGSLLHLKVLETIYHPGHYRVALAVNSREELPADPMTFERTTDKGPRSVWGVIQSPPQLPGDWPTACSRTIHDRPARRPTSRTFACRTSPARSARCR